MKGDPKRIHIEIVILLVAVILSILLMPIGFIYGIVKTILTFNLRGAIYKTANFLRAISVSIDKLGNVICGDLFNDLFRVKFGESFGDGDETISDVLGENKRDGTLKRPGVILSNILDWIDPNHVINSIEEDAP